MDKINNPKVMCLYEGELYIIDSEYVEDDIEIELRRKLTESDDRLSYKLEVTINDFVLREFEIAKEESAREYFIKICEVIDDIITANNNIRLKELIRLSHKNAKEKGFWDRETSFGSLIALVHSEVSEALEDYRGNNDIDKIYKQSNGKPCGVPVELADAVIRIFDICGGYNIDLEEAIKVKMEYNKTRDYRHEDKRI